MKLSNVTYWDGRSENLSQVAEIELDAGVIKSVGGTSSAAETLDCTGLTLLPGLIDAHVHMCLDPEEKDPLAHGKVPEDQQIEQMLVRAERMLRAGITTARDLGGGRWLELKVRDMIDSGDKVGTRLICAGQPVTSVQGHCYFWGGEADNLEQASEVINRQIQHGVDLIKIMATGGSITPGSKPVDSQFNEAEMCAMVAEAKASGYRVAAHCHGSDGISNAATAGVTTIEHCSWVGEAGWARDYRDEVVQKIVANDVWVSPTINAGWQRYKGTKSFEGVIAENYKKMLGAGVKMIASTDAGIPGVRHHDLPRAIPVFAHFAGLTPVQALRAATSDCAEALGLGQQLGQIAPGFAADIVAYANNPLEDLEALAEPEFVIARGRRVD
ncbi:MAG: amidohydrolase family protein [Pseudomonadales bacterium]